MLENLEADFERHLKNKASPEGPHDEWMVVSDTDLEPVLRELRASRKVVEAARRLIQLRDAEHLDHDAQDFARRWNASLDGLDVYLGSLVNVRSESVE